MFVLCRAAVRRWVREASDRQIFIVFIVIDASKESILDVKSVNYASDGSLSMTSYIDEFPFQDYIILRDTKQVNSTTNCVLNFMFFFLLLSCQRFYRML